MLFSIASATMWGQKEDLTLEKIYSTGEFQPKSFGPVRWLEDGSGYTALEPSETADGKDIIKYNPESDERTVLVKASSFIPEGEDQPLNIKDYSWSKDKEKLLIFTNTKRVWRYHTRGDFWVLNCNNYPVTIRSNTQNFENMEILPHGLKLIKVKNPFCYKFGDVFCEYNDKRVAVTAIERV